MPFHWCLFLVWMKQHYFRQLFSLTPSLSFLPLVLSEGALSCFGHFPSEEEEEKEGVKPSKKRERVRVEWGGPFKDVVAFYYQRREGTLVSNCLLYYKWNILLFCISQNTYQLHGIRSFFNMLHCTDVYSTYAMCGIKWSVLLSSLYYTNFSWCHNCHVWSIALTESHTRKESITDEQSLRSEKSHKESLPCIQTNNKQAKRWHVRKKKRKSFLGKM